MKKTQFLALCLLSSVIVSLGLSGCAGMGASQNEDLLSAAGFAMVVPRTAAQEQAYANMKPYKMETGIVNGKRLYGYKDPKKGVVYLGGSGQYQAYKNLQVQRNIADENMQAAEMNSESWGYWNAFGPAFYWQ